MRSCAPRIPAHMPFPELLGIYESCKTNRGTSRRAGRSRGHVWFRGIQQKTSDLSGAGRRAPHQEGAGLDGVGDPLASSSAWLPHGQEAPAPFLGHCPVSAGGCWPLRPRGPGLAVPAPIQPHTAVPTGLPAIPTATAASANGDFLKTDGKTPRTDCRGMAK